jgi:hypothetical protein
LDHTGVQVKFEGTSSQVIHELSLGKNENGDTPNRDRKCAASEKGEVQGRKRKKTKKKENWLD